MVDFFAGPVPGQSLTDVPGNAPWERPSEFDTVEEVVAYYVKKFEDENVMDDMAILFKIGANLKSVVTTMMTMGSMKGLHTVETGMLAGPKIASFLKGMLKTYGIDAKETLDDPQEMATRREDDRLKKLLAHALQQAKGSEGDPGEELLMGMAETLDQEETSIQMEEAPVEEQPQGLMARGNV